jgi:acyl-CoA synthetase (AMP-forming)/AMP-acid ligase II
LLAYLSVSLNVVLQKVYYKFVDESLPRNANGKILKKDLRESLAAEYRKIVPKAKL